MNDQHTLKKKMQKKAWFGEGFDEIVFLGRESFEEKKRGKFYVLKNCHISPIKTENTRFSRDREPRDSRETTAKGATEAQNFREKL